MTMTMTQHKDYNNNDLFYKSWFSTIFSALDLLSDMYEIRTVIRDNRSFIEGVTMNSNRIIQIEINPPFTVYFSSIATGQPLDHETDFDAEYIEYQRRLEFFNMIFKYISTKSLIVRFYSKTKSSVFLDYINNQLKGSMCFNETFDLDIIPYN